MVKCLYKTRRSDNNLHTLAHKLSSPDYLRQRWTVGNIEDGYDEESHYWYVPDNIPVRKISLVSILSCLFITT